jgi:arsenate reductase
VPPPADLERYVSARLAERGLVDPARRAALETLAAEVAARVPVALVFVCTHNSRRSHLAAIWAQVAARRFGLDGVRASSAGLEATAFEPRAVAALERAGLRVARAADAAGGDEQNPVYLVDAGDGAPPIRCFSKTLRDAPRPPPGFLAVLTCASAEEACPLVPGAAARIALPYHDPKAADGTAHETETYDERCREIAREMLFALGLAADLG